MSILTNENPEISGLLRKRRGGFGKMMLNAWQQRFFVLGKDGILCYFDLEIPDMETKARGKLDLTAVPYELITDHHVEGAPTAFTIQICPRNDERWNLCAETKEDHYRWCKALERYLYCSANRIIQVPPISYSSDDDFEHKKYSASVRFDDKNTVTVSNNNNIEKNQNVTRHLSYAYKSDELTTTKSKTTTTRNEYNNETNNVAKTTRQQQQQQPLQQQNNIDNKTTTKDFKKSQVSRKGGLKLDRGSKSQSYQEFFEFLTVLGILNLCFYSILHTSNTIELVFYLVSTNLIIIHTLNLRSKRIIAIEKEKNNLISLNNVVINNNNNNINSINNNSNNNNSSNNNNKNNNATKNIKKIEIANEATTTTTNLLSETATSFINIQNNNNNDENNDNNNDAKNEISNNNVESSSINNNNDVKPIPGKK
jgi:hypothetical protein